MTALVAHSFSNGSRICLGEKGNVDVFLVGGNVKSRGRPNRGRGRGQGTNGQTMRI
jgi:hypothetical protein